MSSTGVIGVRLPKEKISEGAKNFDFTKRDGIAASEAIMTTDTFSKRIAYEVILADGSSFKIGAMAKGAGMINPAMATMLCFITTDALVDKQTMQALLDECTHTTFNAASVDGDTSTNDTVLLMSNGLSGTLDAENDTSVPAQIYMVSGSTIPSDPIVSGSLQGNIIDLGEW